MITAGFALIWIIARAASQSITIDEADTYLAYVVPATPDHWQAAANNHVLNSMLMRVSTSVFGASNLAVRAPALLGALIYIGAAFILCMGISKCPLLRLSLFVCLVYNPFVMDHLVAARGYSLAIGFLMAAIAVGTNAARGPAPWRDPVATSAAVSLLLGLSFAVNYSFGLVNGSVGFFLLWAPWRSARWPMRFRIAAAATLPGALTAAFLVGSVLAGSSMGEFGYGATSLHEMGKTVWDASLFEPNPFIVNPPLREVLHKWNWLVPVLLGAAALWRLAAVAFRRRAQGDDYSRWLRHVGQIAAGALAAAIGIHWLLFRSIHLLLPRDRTALYIAPLAMLAVGALAALPSDSFMGRLSARAATASFLIAALYFLCCLRLMYFKEWRYCSDSQAAYNAIAYYNHEYGVRKVSSCWKYFATLNFYRKSSGRENSLVFDLPPIDQHIYPPDRQVYVLEPTFDDEFIAGQKLKVVYRGPRSGMMVAIRPSLEENPASYTCSTQGRYAAPNRPASLPSVACAMRVSDLVAR